MTGKGFEIRIVNAATGAQIAVPAGVNTPDDELHPALSADGRSLVFTRMKLQPKLNGDIVPPTERIAALGRPRRPGRSRSSSRRGHRRRVHVDDRRPRRPCVGTVPSAPRPTGAFDTAEGQLAAARHACPCPPAARRRERRHPRERRRDRDVPHAASIAGLFTETIFGMRAASRAPARAPPATSRSSYHDPITGAISKSVSTAVALRPARAASSNELADRSACSRSATTAPRRAPRPAQRRRLRRPGPDDRRGRRHPLDHLPGRDADDGGAGADHHDEPGADAGLVARRDQARLRAPYRRPAQARHLRRHARHPDRGQHAGRDRRRGPVTADARVPERLRRALDRQRAAVAGTRRHLQQHVPGAARRRHDRLARSG